MVAGSDFAPVSADVGFTKSESSRCQHGASVPPEKPSSYVEENAHHRWRSENDQACAARAGLAAAPQRDSAYRPRPNSKYWVW
jgi:hypothetical protein